MKSRVPLLLTSVMVIAICGILYELLISTISSYFQGSSILHFSIVIGLFLSSMGIGSYLSKFIQYNLLTWFIRFEILLSLIGGFSAVCLYFAYSLTPYFYLVTFSIIVILGSLIGIEIPILTRIVREYESLKDAMAKVLSFDYLGSLLASVAFPLLLLPFLGLMKTAFIIGMLNLFVACLNLWMFRDELRLVNRLAAWALVVGISLTAGFLYSFQITSFFESFLYRDQIVFTRQSAYQRLVMTKRNQDFRLFIDGNIQFSSRDEYRYHEPLVHIPIALSMKSEKVLILGGGDGLAVREILKHTQITQIVLVDLDPEMTQLGATHPIFTKLNEASLADPKVQILNEDGFKYIERTEEIFDVIIIDLPDPHSTSLGKLYAAEFYELVSDRLTVGGTLVTQSSSPYFAREAFWCIYKTMKSVFPHTLPYHVQVPAFGEWGFNMAIKSPSTLPLSAGDPEKIKQWSLIKIRKDLFQESSIPLKFLNTASIPNLFVFPRDMDSLQVEINHIENQKLIQYYESSWDKWR